MADNLAVRVLNTMLVQDTTAPVIAASHNLRANRTLLSTGFGGQRSQWMLFVLAARILGTLDRNEALILAGATLHQQPIDVVMALVLVPLDKVPAKDKVLCNIIDAIANQAHRDVVPRHSPVLGLTELIVLPVVDTLEVHDTVVVEVLAGEDVVTQAGWMHVG